MRKTRNQRAGGSSLDYVVLPWCFQTRQSRLNLPLPHLCLPNEEPTSTTAIHDCSATRAIPLKRPMPWSVALRTMILTHAPGRPFIPQQPRRCSQQRELRTVISITASPHLSCGNRASILHKWDTRAQREVVTYPRSWRLISLSRPNPKYASGLGLGWTGQRPPLS